MYFVALIYEMDGGRGVHKWFINSKNMKMTPCYIVIVIASDLLSSSNIVVCAVAG